AGSRLGLVPGLLVLLHPSLGIPFATPDSGSPQGQCAFGVCPQSEVGCQQAQGLSSPVFSKFSREAGRLVDAALRTGRPMSLVRRYRYLYFERRFSPDEIRFFRLLDPSFDDSDLARFISKEELLAVQHELNRAGVHDWTEDKLEFHRRCV